MADIVRIRTARKEHPCGGYLCDAPILPGERYEIHSAAPWTDGNEGPRWVVAKVHLSLPGGYFGSGCDEAAAYLENAGRTERASA